MNNLQLRGGQTAESWPQSLSKIATNQRKKQKVHWRKDIKKKSFGIMIIIITITIIMDGSCIVQIFPSRKLRVLAHTIHANIHTDINIMYPPPTPSPHYGPPRFVEMPVEKGQF